MSKENVSVILPLNLFFILFPTDFIKNIILPKTNESLSEACNSGEFIVLIGLWSMMGLMQGFERSQSACFQGPLSDLILS
jgi:hypothetical protein